MSSRYQYRSFKRAQNKSRQNFAVSLIIIIALLYITFVWILPNLIGGLGFIKNLTQPNKKVVNLETQTTLAPPVLNIPYEATNTAQINISGYANPGVKVELFMDDEKKDTVDTALDGSFDIKNISLSLGTNNIYAKTIDDAGKESLPSKNIKIIYDNEKPALSISEPEDNKTINGGDKKVKISGKTEPGARVYINSTQVIVDKEGNFSQTLDLSEGDNDFNIKAFDQALNTTETTRKVIYKP